MLKFYNFIMIAVSNKVITNTQLKRSCDSTYVPQATKRNRAKTALSYAFLVTLAYGDHEDPTLAQVVFLSQTEGEDTRTVAEAVLRHTNNTEPQTSRFDWSTLRVNGSEHSVPKTQ